MRLKYLESSMSSSFACKAAICFCWGLFLAFPGSLFAQTNYYGFSGTEYAVSGSLAGDQAWPDAAAAPTGGIVVWQDNATDGNGWGVSARRLDSTLSGILSSFRINATGTNDQQNPRVALLKNGGAVTVWQGGKQGFQHIYGRFLSPTNTFLTTTDVLISVTNKFQVRPAVAVLNNSNVIVVWSSMRQVSSNSMQDVYGQLLSPVGQKIGTNFLVNQFTSYNQRDPSVTALKNGGFVVTWVSEQQRIATTQMGTNTTFTSTSSAVYPSVDIYSRLYQSNGVAATTEFLVNSDNNPCANPQVKATADGNYVVVWSAKDMGNLSNSWDIWGRSFSNSTATANGPVVRLNDYTYGDQFGPRLAALNNELMVVWTSLAQDGYREGVFSRFMHSNGSLVGNEQGVNTTVEGQQMYPVVTSDTSSQFLAVWSGFTGLPHGFDLFGQRYLNVNALLAPMSAPFVYAPFTLASGVYQPQLQVSWPRLLGISVSNYEVYVDGNASPSAVTTNTTWLMTTADGLSTNSTRTFRVAYVITGGGRSPLSPSASGTTWSGESWNGVPVEWMTAYFGADRSHWPLPAADTDGDSISNLSEFLTGTDPMDANSVLRQQVIQTPQGMFLVWNTQAGLTYQIQITTNFVSWNNFGQPRFAVGTNDSVNVPAGYFRIQVLR